MNYSISKGETVFYIFAFALAVVNLLSCNLPFFWDCMIESKRCMLYEQTGFQLILPQNLDAGHPPFFSWYLYISWLVMGKSLYASHLAMLPILLGIALQLWGIAKKYIEKQHHPILFVLLFLEPTFLTQSTMISSDIVLVFFYLLAINQLSEKKNIWYFLALVGLLFTNLRGMVMVGSLFFIDILIFGTYYKKNLKILLKSAVPYAIATFLFLILQLHHFYNTGWVLFTTSENWSSGRELVGWKLILKNIAIIIHHFTDFGRFMLLLSLLITFIVFLKKKIELPTTTKRLFIFSFVTIFMLSISFLPFSNPIGCRYFMVTYLLLIILFVNLLKVTELKTTTKNILVILIAGNFIAGHFWVYPEKIAQSWDSSLLHLRYFPIKKAMDSYLIENNIPLELTGTQFPYESPHSTELNGDTIIVKHFDFQKNSYIIYSNVTNDFTDNEIDLLHNEWKLLHEERNGSVFIQLYRKPEKK